MASRKNRDKRIKALKRLVESIVKREGSIEVIELVEKVRSKFKADVEEVIEAIKFLEAEGKIDLCPPPISVTSYIHYLGLVEENGWFYLLTGAVLGTLLSIYILPDSLPWIVIRWILGSIFVLYLPGYVVVEALFPEKKELSGIERLALSLGLSLAIVPLLGLVLNYTPWGIRLNPITITLSLAILALGLLATYRKYKLALMRKI